MSCQNIKIYGIVQGVGFRPFVSRLADSIGILGNVCNKGPYVEIHAAGSRQQLEKFRRGLEAQAPERSTILKIDVQEDETVETFHRFEIIESAKEQGDIFVSPDIAVCEKCQKELFDPKDRRYLHPFINCTACGPRLTILEAMPYDRERTSMKAFPMCEKCRDEYTHAETRRYDAQPVCCNDCGPELYLLGEDLYGNKALSRTRQIIASGGIAAIKGIGGFHLCCDAANVAAVHRLRQLKHRPFKPFAVMLKDLDAVRRECHLLPEQESLLDGHQKPILLLPRRREGRIAEITAPGNPKLGILLPYAPLHLLLFDYPDGIPMPDALVMTSGNPSGAPICHNDEEAEEALRAICDCILSHNRRIRLRADDSVMDWLEEKPYMVRRSRGYAPLPVMLEKDFAGQVLAMGGELKNTFCLARNNLFYPSPYIGDMTDLRAVLALKDSIGLMESLLEIRPDIVACDLHPRYHTRQVAESLNLPLFPVQHHYAHILSCMAENSYTDPVLGISFDGTGYGTDGSIWGGELLRADVHGFERLGSIEPFPQTGGDKAAREGWRIAVSLLRKTVPDEDSCTKIIRSLDLCSPKEMSAQLLMTRFGTNTVVSTSAGRLFDAVSALLGIRKTSTFEGEASMYLEFAAETCQDSFSTAEILSSEELQSLTRLIPADAADDRQFLLPTMKLFHYLLKQRLDGKDTGHLASLFHELLAEQIRTACRKLGDITNLHTVALSGGVFQNRLLVSLTKEKLEQDGFRVLLHSLIPPNDGGLCLGQAVAAMHHLCKYKSP